ncbi:MAG: aminoglycoside phosphotransferase family protein [Bacilli bacterium]|nr:aminoglycoside phosphotransferase family protein [Bacilli bacterium]
MSKSAIEIAVEDFEEISKTKVVSVTRLSEGTANEVFLINWNYVFRVKQPDDTDAKFNKASNELMIIQSMSEDDRSPMPKVLAFDARTGNKIEFYIHPRGPLVVEGNPQITYQNCCDAIFAIHELHCVSGPYAFFDCHERLDYYKIASGKGIRSDYERQLRIDAEGIINNDRGVLCHNDLWSGNLLLTDEPGKPCYLIDFEFAGNNGEIFDLASLLEENELPFDMCKRLITRYYGAENVTGRLISNVFKVMEYQDLLWYYWAYARYLETLKDSFLLISKAKFKRVERNIRRWAASCG